ncbi:hypothetical protein [Brachybacterium saurashtrense]|uniref:DUF4878 domain-containing protein n=1 Tax=Brachybacterium saurashtrense TaxID=556288 RepID=A0A345YP01_9MICO|nr:hypothetical protein [Brachybacterium saurashtrense]AXK45653.1 hypothetical protein DWV08_08540 [Brachybacterium saurashtrense]RRR24670.1 hypothetical protein DXU92_00285 [Brachybacterium saurashtrense]
MTTAPPSGPSAPSPASRPRRPLWHWLLLAGVGAVGLLVVAVLGVIIAIQLLTRGNPQATLEDYYSSLETQDCELFMDSTTAAFREAAGVTGCDAFEQAVGSATSIDFEVDDRTNRRGYAIFTVTERHQVEGQELEATLSYYVRRIDGQWDLDGIVLDEIDGEPVL